MRFIFPIVSGLLAFCWAIYLSAGNRIASALGGRFEGILQRISKGKISDPVTFLYQRGKEFLLLATVLLLLSLALWWLARFLRKGAFRQAWLFNGIAGFLALNIFVAVAMNTALFWGAMFTGSRTANYTQFQFKRVLVPEHPAPFSALLLGSSQTQAQIDENQLNALVGTNLWTTELHFPGSAALDVLLTYESIRRTPADFLLIYLSEGYFFNGLHIETPPFFARLEHIPLYRSFGLGREVCSRPFRYGFFAEIIPLFRAREAITHRVPGPDLGWIGQTTHDTTLKEDLEERADFVATRFRFDSYVDVQKRAFEEFIRRSSNDGCTIILFEGQLNPVLGRKLPSGMREDMKKYLSLVAARYPNVRLVPEAELPPQSPADYVDLTHVTPEGQRRFTLWLVRYLEKNAGTAN